MLHNQSSKVLKNWYKYPYKHNGHILVTPNVELIARELTEKGHIKMMINNISKLTFKQIIFLALNNLSFIHQLIKKDFATGIKILIEIDVLATQSKNVILHQQITDMAIALKNYKLIHYFLKLSETYNFQPGLITYNIQPCIKFLSQIPEVASKFTIYTSINQGKYYPYSKNQGLTEYLKNSHITFVNIDDEIFVD